MNRALFQCSLTLGLGWLAAAAGHGEPTPTEAAWTTINRNLVGRWFTESRLGIVVQWGVASVPGISRDYARLMYLPPEPTQPNPVWKHHVDRYGHPSEFGYKDLLPYWEAEKWSPKALAATFKKAGASFVVVLAADRDNIDLFDSRHHGWNAAAYGPRRDVVAEWAQAIRAEGLRLGLAFNNGRSLEYLRPAHGAEWEGEYKDRPFDGAETPRDGSDQWWRGLDPADLYGRARGGNPFAPLPKTQSPAVHGGDASFQQTWYLRASEIVMRVRPDLVWIEGGLPHGAWGLRLAAEFLSSVNNGRPDPKNGLALVLPPTPAARPLAYVQVSDRASNETGPWMAEVDLARDGIRTDATPALSAAQLLNLLALTVSKGGNLCIRVALRADGSLPEDQGRVLKEVGSWMQRNPGAFMGAGPSIEARTESRSLPVMVTRHENLTFVFLPQWPGASRVTLLGLKDKGEGTWNDGSKATLQGEEDRLILETPAQAPDSLLSVLILSDRALDLAY